MKAIFIQLLSILLANALYAQQNIVTYAGKGGKETFYDVMQISDGTFIVCGYSDNLSWIPGDTPEQSLLFEGSIPNSLGTNKYGIILHLSSDLSKILHLTYFDPGVVEDIRFIKTNSIPYKATGELYISCTIAGHDKNTSGYVIAKLDKNYLNGIPSKLDWYYTVSAKNGPQDYQPWDVTSDGKVYFISGESHGYDWSAVYCLDQKGKLTVKNNWRTHWLSNGKEWKGTPASANPLGKDSVSYSAIVLKSWGRCDLRSWTSNDYNRILDDGNGGKKKGLWPLDVLFGGPCDPEKPSAVSPGYTGYSVSGTPVYGGTSLSVDRRNNNFYIGMNFKSVLPDGLPDFEPAVIAMDSSGSLRWWSRLYHEITPLGDTVNSTPDQYIDALGIDYANDRLVVGARCHGNNVENFWQGNKIHQNQLASGFQNRFTGSSGNIHISWLGKLQLKDGIITNSTFMGELAEGTGSLGSKHQDANLDSWPDPNQGWANLNTTRMAKNGIKVTSAGEVVVLATGRRTITTANAYQKMVKPQFGGKSSWNSFVRVYDPDLKFPKYSSLVVGVWDTLTQAGGDNTELFGVYKASHGVVCVGRHKADATGKALGNNIPVTSVTPWGNAIAENESAVLVYYKADNLYNVKDNFSSSPNAISDVEEMDQLLVYPNPSSKNVFITLKHQSSDQDSWKYKLSDATDRTVQEGALIGDGIEVQQLISGIYQLLVYSDTTVIRRKIIILR